MSENDWPDFKHLPWVDPAARQVLRHPYAFARNTLSRFGANQGLLLAGAVAYYALLSLVPLAILSVIALSHWLPQATVVATLGHYLEWLVPSQSQAVVADIEEFLDHRVAIGSLLLATMLFFSSLAFSVLEKAMAVIFAHRKAAQTRHALVSAILPYSFVLLLGLILLAVSIVSVVLQTMAQENLHLLGRDWSLRGLSGILLHGLGLATEIALLTLFYLILPVGRTRLRHAVVGAATATLIWEGVRRILIWYFTTLSKASIVYGSLTTAVVALFSMEIAATLLLFGAQVIAEYEQLG